MARRRRTTRSAPRRTRVSRRRTVSTRRVRSSGVRGRTRSSGRQTVRIEIVQPTAAPLGVQQLLGKMQAAKPKKAAF